MKKLQEDATRIIPVVLEQEDSWELVYLIEDIKESKRGAEYSKTVLLGEIDRRNLAGLDLHAKKIQLVTPYFYQRDQVSKLSDHELVIEYIRTSELVKATENLINRARLILETRSQRLF